ncbi:MAG: bifunctional (p)ppGpp synthetase/guanosine-3',5'-bis(diphosphate) 3'-pyrophosphohydrolase [Coriobacteriia bacterium]|nr:bifunctional (p)ppGpp synthetase/guanosine-3',5'-bis(diphosphate) 3'-pyrophosphohydrolase [Coriobacteriia bacterium]
MAEDRKVIEQPERISGDGVVLSSEPQVVQVDSGQPDSGIVIRASGTPVLYEATLNRLDGYDNDTQDVWLRLVQQVESYLDDDQIDKIKLAFSFADSAHRGVIRKSGEAYINHPLHVALTITELRMDTDTICAALLHDTVEDSEVTLEEVSYHFGSSVRDLVDGVTKITRIEVKSLSEQQVETIRKMLLAMSEDIRVIVIKLADRLHNMQTLEALREDRQLFKAREALEIYAPLADRLGIYSIKWQLEDLAFKYLEPARYMQVSRMIDESRSMREDYIADAISILSQEIDKLGIDARITGRPKHLWSIYRKMSEKGKDFSDIYDLIAIRIIVAEENECYACLGAVHALWTPDIGRFKDYIAVPKLNGYQSLHTTVIGPAGRHLEVQIRSDEMHRVSEFGIAAHWRYKGTRFELEKQVDEQLWWLRQMLEWTEDTDNPREFMETLRYDLNYTEVFVFTPKGDVIRLPAGASPIDFAYAIHTEVGHRCVGAKVNGMIVPLSYELKMGDRVDVLTQKHTGPSRDWLNLVKTASARSKIRSYLAKQGRGDDIVHGRDLLSSEMRRHGLGIASARSQKAMRKIASEHVDGSVDDMLALIGAGKLSARQIANRLLRELAVDEDKGQFSATDLLSIGRATGAPQQIRQSTRAPSKRTSTGVVVKGLDDVLVRLAHCCNPVPGDTIIGFVTRGRGVSVHRQGCPNASSLLNTPERIIPVNWAEAGSENTYVVEVFIEAADRLRLYEDVTSALASSGVNMTSASMQVHRDGIVEMRYTFEVSEIDHINRILRDLRGVDGVIDARRLHPGEVTQKRR